MVDCNFDPGKRLRTFSRSNAQLQKVCSHDDKVLAPLDPGPSTPAPRLYVSYNMGQLRENITGNRVIMTHTKKQQRQITRNLNRVTRVTYIQACLYLQSKTSPFSWGFLNGSTSHYVSIPGALQKFFLVFLFYLYCFLVV